MYANTPDSLSVDTYLASFSEDVQRILQQIRAVILEAAPGAEEKISYGMLGYFLDGGLLWIGAYKRHVGFYPKTQALDALPELEQYKGTKSSVHFPLNRPIPYDLIRRMVELRVAETRGETG